MPHLIITWEAHQGIQRCNRFLKAKSASAARRAQKVIDAEIECLIRMPLAGRYWAEDKNYREWIIPFGSSAYLALYSYDKEKDEVKIVSFRHGRENAYPFMEALSDKEN